MAQVTITIDPNNPPKPTTHPSVQVWDDAGSGTSMHELGQTSIEQAKRIIIDSGSGSTVTLTPVPGHTDQFTLSFT